MGKKKRKKPSRKASKRGRRSNLKGKVGEREAAKALSGVLGIASRRGQQYSGIGGEDVVGLDGVHIEVKRAERFNVYAAMNQSAVDACLGDYEVPVVLHRRNGERWIVCCYLDDLPEVSARVQEALKSSE